MTSPDSPQRREALKAVALASLGLPAGVLAQQPKDGIKELRYPFEVAETGFDPAQINDIYSRIVISNIFEGLYDYDHLARPFKIRPCTAAAMPEVSDDFRTYVVRAEAGHPLPGRPGLQWQAARTGGARITSIRSSGSSIHAGSRRRTPRSPRCGSSGLHRLRERALKDKTPFDYDTPVEGLRALDRYTLQFKFEATAASLSSRLLRPATFTARWRARWSRPTATRSWRSRSARGRSG